MTINKKISNNIFKTTKNHYVPRYYLEKFLLGEPLSKLIKDQNKIINFTNFSTECSKDHLYTVKNKISNELVSLFCEWQNLDESDVLLTNIKDFLNGEFRKFFNIIYKDDESIQAMIDKLQDPLDIKESWIKSQEELFTHLYEDGFNYFYNKIIDNINFSMLLEKNNMPKFEVQNYLYLKYYLVFYKFYISLFSRILEYPTKNDDIEVLKNNLKKIAKDELKFDSDEDIHETFYDIILYIFVQLFRTKSYIKKIKDDIKDRYHVLSENEQNNLVFLYIHTIPLLKILNLMEKETCLLILKNDTQEEFITSDNPVCITNSKYGFCYFMSLNKNLAILFTNKVYYLRKSLKKHLYICRNKKVVKYINNKLYGNSDNCLYGSNDALQKILVKELSKND